MYYIPKIDYKYWLSKSETEETSGRSSSIQGIITNLTNKGYIKPGNILYDLVYTSDQKRKPMQDIWNDAKKISTDLGSFENDDKLLAIFDAIQIWGGRMGKGMYVMKGKNGIPTREEWKEWLPLYREAINLATMNQPGNALKILDNINQFGISFATKHLGFWADYPIYDTRMSKMIFGKNPNVKDYDNYVNILSKISTDEGINTFEVEQALFTFSLNYFDNNLKKMNIKLQYSTDIDEAIKIFNFRNK